MLIEGQVLRKRNTIWIHLIKNHSLIVNKQTSKSFHLVLIRDVIVGIRNMYALTLGNHYRENIVP